MHLKEVGHEVVDRLHLAQEQVQLLVLMNSVMKLLVPLIVHFFASFVTVSLL